MYTKSSKVAINTIDTTDAVDIDSFKGCYFKVVFDRVTK